MSKYKTILNYFLIAVLFVVTISVANPVKVNAADNGEPYDSCLIIPK